MKAEFIKAERRAVMTNRSPKYVFKSAISLIMAFFLLLPLILTACTADETKKSSFSWDMTKDEYTKVANEKIKRDYLGLANRRNNFEVVNIAKTVESAGETIDAINKLTKKGKMKNLPKGLQETARLRVDNPYANLEELAKLHSDRISKSGVNHRLKKLLELANDD